MFPTWTGLPQGQSHVAEVLESGVQYFATPVRPVAERKSGGVAGGLGFEPYAGRRVELRESGW
jgi:hypothetical protein